MRANGDERIVWKSAGFHLTERGENGWLAVGPDFLRAYWTRPEIHPVAESCAVEHRLFERLMDDPFAAVAPGELAEIADRDAAENYAVVLRFRDHLVAAGSIEAGYLGLFAPGAPLVPPVFFDQLVHLIMTNILVGEQDPLVARAAELFFRDQIATTSDERFMLADAEVVATRGAVGSTFLDVEIDTLTARNAADYWDRADRFDFGLDFRFAEPGQDAFSRLIERWLKHFLALPVRVQPLRSVVDQAWRWHIGLDAEATRILNALYAGETLPMAGQGRIGALFRMEFIDPDRVTEDMRGRPAFLGLSVDAAGRVRMKPQNLLTNLPLAEPRH